jgi:hypothetical protein
VVISPVVGAMAYTSTIRVDTPFPISVNAVYWSVSAGPCRIFVLTCRSITTKRIRRTPLIIMYSIRVLTPASLRFSG